MTIKLICIGGFSGSGKTTLAARLHQNIENSVVVDPDHAWLEIIGKDPEEDTLIDDDIDLKKIADVIGLMIQRTEDGLNASKTVIIGSSFRLGNMRDQYEALGKKHDIEFIGVWLDVDEKTRMGRAQKRLLDHAKRKENGLSRGFNASAVSAEKVSNARLDGQLTWPKVDASSDEETTYIDVSKVIGLASGSVVNSELTYKKN